MREVQWLARLDHPNVIRYYAAWIERDLTMDASPIRPQVEPTEERSDDPVRLRILQLHTCVPISEIACDHLMWLRFISMASKWYQRQQTIRLPRLSPSSSWRD